MHPAISSIFFVISTIGAFLAISPLLGGFEKKAPFDERPLLHLVKETPKVVLVGNSMLASRIEARTLGQSLKKKTALVAQPGSMSARWYLFLKNYAAPVKPRIAFVLFRDTELTEPRYRTEGRYRLALEQAMRDEDEKFMRNKLADKGNFSWFLNTLEASVPTIRSSYRIQENAKRRFLLGAFGAKGLHHATVLQKEIFERATLRRDLAADSEQQVSAHEFSSALPDSLLPDMLELARSSGFGLIFYRIKTRRHFEEPDSPELQRYISSLNAHLSANHALLVDETGRQEIKESKYSDGDHLAKRHRRRYTRQFARFILEEMRKNCERPQTNDVRLDAWEIYCDLS